MLTDKPILVTGAGGWVASHTIYQLLDKGYKVRGTVRDVKSRKYVFLETFHPKAQTNLELVEADLLEPKGWKEAAAGCEYVLHLASPFTFSAKDPELEVVKPAVEGVRNVFNGCLQNPEVKRIVQTSSICSCAFGHPKSRYKCNRKVLDAERREWQKAQKLVTVGASQPTKADESSETVSTGAPPSTETVQPAANDPTKIEDARVWNSKRLMSQIPSTFGDWKLMDETDWTVPEKVEGYELSKVLAEKEAWKIIEEHNKKNPDRKVELTVMLPAFIFGPIFCTEQEKGESSVHVKRILDRTYPLTPQINCCHVDVRDVAKAHILGFERPEAAFERFLLATPDGNIDMVEQSRIINDQFRRYGFNVATMAAPNYLLKLGGLFDATMKVAAAKTSVLAYGTNKKAYEQLGMTEWRSIYDALWSHCITLMKEGVVDWRSTPPEMINGYTPY